MEVGQLQVNYWDRVANEKRFSHPLQADWLAQRVSPPSRILDYGCGYGRTLAELSRAGFANLTGTDFAELMLRRARAEVPGPNLVLNDGHSFPFADECFDVVILFAVLTCIPGDGDQRKLVSEAHRVLRPGGLLYLSDLLINNDERNRSRYEREAQTYDCYGVFELPEGVVVRHHRKEWIDELLKPFEQWEYAPFTVTTMNGNSSAAFQYLGRKLKDPKEADIVS